MPINFSKFSQVIREVGELEFRTHIFNAVIPLFFVDTTNFFS